MCIRDSGLGGTATSSVRSALTEVEQRGQYYAADAGPSPMLRWVLPILLLLGLIGLLLYFAGRKPPLPEAPSIPTVSAPALSIPVPSSLGAFMDKLLPTGVSLHIPAAGVESKLIAFIEDTTKPINPDTWFSFDRLEFETNTSTLKPCLLYTSPSPRDS